MLGKTHDNIFQIWFHVDQNFQAEAKRQIFSLISSIFDSMGVTGPVIIIFKEFMQTIWSLIVPYGNKTKKIYWRKVNLGNCFYNLMISLLIFLT